MLLEITSLVLLMHFFINQIQYLFNRKIVFYLFGFILFAVIVYFLMQISYTADYAMYESFYKWEFEKTDFVFHQSALFFKKNNYGFQKLFSAHMLLISILYYLFILKFEKNIFYVFGAYILILFIPYVNQIRYFMAFPLFLLAAYYLLYKRKLPLFLIFAVLGFLSHSAIIVLYIIFPVYLYLPKRYYKSVMIYGSIILFIASYLVSTSSLHLLLDHFGEYIKNENQSSVLGGLFNTLPLMAMLIPLYLLDKKYKGDRTLPVYIFLKRMSFITTTLIPASIFIQIIGFRYVLPFVVVWIVFFLYLLKASPLKYKTLYLFTSYVIMLAVIFLQYSLANYVFGNSVLMKELYDTLESIKN